MQVNHLLLGEQKRGARILCARRHETRTGGGLDQGCSRGCKASRWLAQYILLFCALLARQKNCPARSGNDRQAEQTVLTWHRRQQLGGSTRLEDSLARVHEQAALRQHVRVEGGAVAR